MRIFGTLVPLLIAGILGPSIAQEYNGPWFRTQLREKCERNGGPDAYYNYNYTASVENLSNCFGNLVNLQQLEAELIAADERTEELESVYQRYSYRVPAFKSCLQRSIDYVDSCLSTDERQSLYVLSSAADTLLRYASLSGDVVSRFVRHGGKQCVESNYPSLESCGSRSFRRSSSEGIGINIPGLGVLPSLSVNLEGCREIESYQNCIVNILQTCEDPSTAQIVGYLFNLFKTDSNCATQIAIDESQRNSRRNEGNLGYFRNFPAYGQPSEIRSQTRDSSDRWNRFRQPENYY